MARQQCQPRPCPYQSEGGKTTPTQPYKELLASLELSRVTGTLGESRIQQGPAGAMAEQGELRVGFMGLEMEDAGSGAGDTGVGDMGVGMGTRESGTWGWE